MQTPTEMSAEDIKKGLIACFKDPEVMAIIKEQLLAPLVQQAVADGMVARDEEISHLKQELAKQKQEVNDLEQYSRKNCLTISGLPDKPNESVSQTVTELARAVGVELLPADIDAAHRIGAPNRSKARPIIVKLTRFDKRQELYAARKRIRSAELPRGSLITAAEADSASLSLTASPSTTKRLCLLRDNSSEKAKYSRPGQMRANLKFVLRLKHQLS